MKYNITNTKIFCLNCYSRNIYVRKKTHDYVCRKCGQVINIDYFFQTINDFLSDEKAVNSLIVEPHKPFPREKGRKDNTI